MPQELGAQVLPLPMVGEPLEFELTDLQGKPARSSELKGNVVLIDGWAT